MNVDQGIGTYEVGPSTAGTSYMEDPLRCIDPMRSRDQIGHSKGSEHCVIPHPCTTCGNICYGPSSEFRGDGLLQYVSQTRSSYSLLFFISQFPIVS